MRHFSWLLRAFLMVVLAGAARIVWSADPSVVRTEEHGVQVRILVQGL